MPECAQQYGASRWLRLLPASGTRKRKQCRLYRIWTDMHGRCYNPNVRSYRDYGARGIRICDEWRDYAVFRAWAISTGYGKGLTIDREDNDGDYCPDNCRWLAHGLQQWNTRRVIYLTHNGVTKPLPQWAREAGINPDIYRCRRSKGWTDSQIVTTPILPLGVYREGVQHKKRGRKPAPSLGGNP